MQRSDGRHGHGQGAVLGRRHVVVAVVAPGAQQFHRLSQSDDNNYLQCSRPKLLPPGCTWLPLPQSQSYIRPATLEYYYQHLMLDPPGYTWLLLAASQVRSARE